MFAKSAASPVKGGGTRGKTGMGKTLIAVLIIVIIVVGVVAAFIFVGPAVSVTKQNFAPYSAPASQSSSNPPSLLVTDINGGITLSSWSQTNVMINGTVTARGFGTSPGAITFIESNSSGNIVFKAIFPAQSFFSFSASYAVDINVYVPASAQFNSVQIVTVNGDLKVSTVSASSVTMTDTNGNISASGVTASTVTMTDTNGGIDFTCATSCGSVTATTTNGSVTSTLTSVSLTGTYVMTTTNGGITLKIPATASFKITTNVTNGSVSSTGLSVQLANHATTTFGTGSATVNLTTTNGSITVSG